MSARETFSTVEVQASEWLVAMQDRTVSLEERARFEAWLAADAEHERIYRVQKSAWSTIADMPHLLQADPPASSYSQGEGRNDEFFLSAKKPAKLLLPLAAAAVLLLALGAVFLPRLFGTGRSIETQTAQIKDIRLEDGSLLTLGAASSIAVDFTKTERRVTLRTGEAFFEVTRDTSRPFFVQAGGTQVRVLGTKFDVHYAPDAVRVSVQEGRVEVISSPDSSSLPGRGAKVVSQLPESSIRRVLTKGETVVAVNARELAPVERIAEENLGAWRAGRLVYIDARLREVIADIDRYYDGEIVLADDALGDLQLTTAFRADQIDRMIEVLTTALPIEARRTDRRQIVLTRR